MNLNADIFENYQLLLATTWDEMTHFESFEKLNTSFSFSKLYQNLFSKLKSKFGSINKKFFYNDDPGVHDNERVFDYLKLNNLKTILGSSHSSKFDMCEYVFCRIKKTNYKTIYNNK